MIEVAGEHWGTAAEIAEHIGQGVTGDNVRWWSRYDGLDSVRFKGGDGRPRVLFALGQAVKIEKAKRSSGLGRRRTDLTTG